MTEQSAPLPAGPVDRKTNPQGARTLEAIAARLAVVERLLYRASAKTTPVRRRSSMRFASPFLVGLAEDEVPSFQSREKGDESPEMEEERRNCFVAITRAKECLVLSRAETYRGWRKAPSRFLVEMGLAA
ncbi:MAG: 3'-5' exonuclease [Pseudomonadota bacterium]